MTTYKSYGFETEALTPKQNDINSSPSTMKNVDDLKHSSYEEAKSVDLLFEKMQAFRKKWDLNDLIELNRFIGRNIMYTKNTHLRSTTADQLEQLFTDFSDSEFTINTQLLHEIRPLFNFLIRLTNHASDIQKRVSEIMFAMLQTYILSQREDLIKDTLVIHEVQSIYVSILRASPSFENKLTDLLHQYGIQIPSNMNKIRLSIKGYPLSMLNEMFKKSIEDGDNNLYQIAHKIISEYPSQINRVLRQIHAQMLKKKTEEQKAHYAHFIASYRPELKGELAEDVLNGSYNLFDADKYVERIIEFSPQVAVLALEDVFEKILTELETVIKDEKKRLTAAQNNVQTKYRDKQDAIYHLKQ